MFMEHLWKEGAFYNELRDNGFDIVISFPAPAEINIKISNSFLKQEDEKNIALQVDRIPAEGEPYDHHELHPYTEEQIAALIEENLKKMVTALYHTSAIITSHLMSCLDNVDIQDDDYIQSLKLCENTLSTKLMKRGATIEEDAE